MKVLAPHSCEKTHVHVWMHKEVLITLISPSCSTTQGYAVQTDQPMESHSTEDEGWTSMERLREQFGSIREWNFGEDVGRGCRLRVVVEDRVSSVQNPQADGHTHWRTSLNRFLQARGQQWDYIGDSMLYKGNSLTSCKGVCTTSRHLKLIIDL